MPELNHLLDRLEELLAEVEQLAEPTRTCVFDLLDGIDDLHRTALHNLARAIDDGHLEAAREFHPSVQWLFDAYGIIEDEHRAADAALESIRPYVHSHGGDVEVLDVHDGVVRVKMSGACSGCSASSITLTEGVERALRDGWPGFVRLDVAEDREAKPHPPPGPTLIQIGSPPDREEPGQR